MAAGQKWKMYYHSLAANNTFDIRHPPPPFFFLLAVFVIVREINF